MAIPVESHELVALIQRSLAEDLGSGDVTTQATVCEELVTEAVIVQKQPGVLFGLEIAERVFRTLDPELVVLRRASEGQWRERGEALALRARARALLSGERTALNFLGRLSGVATLSARAVAALTGSSTRLLDTRKTTPGLRALEKAAVRAGGGHNHRAGLYDMMLLKENHLALAGGIAAAVARARAHAPDLELEVECATLADVEQALAAGAGRLLLDNMDPQELRAAVELVDGRALTEASGGVSLQTLPDIARTGVDFVSVGALTHSAPALDLSMLVTPR